jgi:hypothetical protein
MKFVHLLFYTCAAASAVHAGDADFKAFFAYPDTQIITEIAHVRSGGVPFKDHSNPKDPKEAPQFQSSCELNDETDHHKFGVFWRFIQKTEHGDVYLFTVQKDGTVLNAFAVLYSGSTLHAYQHDEIQIIIEPHTDVQ